MADAEGVRVSGNTMRVLVLLLAAAQVAGPGVAWLISHGENNATRDAAESRHSATEKQLIEQSVRLDAHEKLIQRNAEDIKRLDETVNRKLDSIDEQLKDILKAVGRLDGRIGQKGGISDTIVSGKAP